MKESGFIQVPATGRMSGSPLKACLRVSVQARVSTRRERDKEKKEIRGRGCGRQAVSSRVPHGSSLSASWSWSVPAKSLQLGSLRHPKLWSRLFFVKQEPELWAPAICLQRNCQVCVLSISLLVHSILIPLHVKSE